MPDKYSAVWISYSSMSNFLNCPRLYYLNNIYKDPATGRKMTIVNPALALGSVVHNVIEPLAKVRSDRRLDQPIEEKFDSEWSKISGSKGGFSSAEEEEEFRARGEEMIQRVLSNPGPILNKALRLPEHRNGMPPNFYLSEDENIILCGKIDWIEYLEADDSIHIIDFKTGRREEKDDSLQLPIYLLLASYCQSRKVAKASYWYLDRDDELTPQKLPDHSEARTRVLEKALAVKQAREEKAFSCPQGKTGCMFCQPFERVLAGEGSLVGFSDTNQDVYVLV